MGQRPLDRSSSHDASCTWPLHTIAAYDLCTQWHCHCSMCAKPDKHSDLRHYSKYLFGPDQSHPRPSRPPWAAQARTQNRAEVSQSLSLLRQLPDQLLLLAQLLCWQLLHLPHQRLLADICFSAILRGLMFITVSRSHSTVSRQGFLVISLFTLQLSFTQ